MSRRIPSRLGYTEFRYSKNERPSGKSAEPNVKNVVLSEHERALRARARFMTPLVPAQMRTKAKIWRLATQKTNGTHQNAFVRPIRLPSTPCNDLEAVIWQR
jgi:hypothetical protein